MNQCASGNIDEESYASAVHATLKKENVSIKSNPEKQTTNPGHDSDVSSRWSISP